MQVYKFLSCGAWFQWPFRGCSPAPAVACWNPSDENQVWFSARIGYIYIHCTYNILYFYTHTHIMSWPNYREAFTVVMLRVRQPFCSAKASCRWARGGSRGRQAIKNRRARHLYTLQSTLYLCLCVCFYAWCNNYISLTESWEDAQLLLAQSINVYNT